MLHEGQKGLDHGYKELDTTSWISWVLLLSKTSWGMQVPQVALLLKFLWQWLPWAEQWQSGSFAMAVSVLFKSLHAFHSSPLHHMPHLGQSLGRGRPFASQ